MTDNGRNTSNEAPKHSKVKMGKLILQCPLRRDDLVPNTSKRSFDTRKMNTRARKGTQTSTGLGLFSIAIFHLNFMFWMAFS